MVFCMFRLIRSEEMGRGEGEGGGGGTGLTTLKCIRLAFRASSYPITRRPDAWR